MLKNLKLLLIIFILINSLNFSFAKEDFFNEGKLKFDEKKIDDSKFLLQRNIVFNPKHAGSYLYLAKIYNLEKNENDYYDVVNMEYMGEGEKIGIQFYDEVTKLEISSIDRPAKEYIYLFGLLLVMLTLFSQKRRLKLSS